MVPENETSTSTIARALWFATGGDWNFLTKLEVIGTGDLPSVFAVSDLATASIGTAGLATAELVATRFGDSPTVRRRSPVVVHMVRSVCPATGLALALTLGSAVRGL